MNLAVRDIHHNFGRFVVTSLGLGLLLAVVLSMLGIYHGLVGEALMLVRVPQADLWVVEEARHGPFAEASRLPGDTREAVAALAGVAEAGSVTFQAVEGLRTTGTVRLFVVGHEPGRPGGPQTVAEGRGIARAHYELVVDKGSRLMLGEKVRLGRRDFTVVGLVENEVAWGGDPVAYMTLKDSQNLQFELQPASARRQEAHGVSQPPTDFVNAVAVRVAPGFAATDVGERARRWKHLAALTQIEQETLLTEAVVDKVRRQIGLFTSILVLVSAALIALIVYTLTLDKLREIATLKLIGAPDRTIVGLIVQQALGMGISGFILGSILVTLAKDHFPRRVIVLPEDHLGLGLVVIVACLLASTLGVRLALKVDASAALGG